jgi:RHS repeat-associated protein
MLQFDPQRHRLQGNQHDNETGLEYFNARNLESDLAQFRSIDPVFHAGQSPYNAFDGNPIFYADPAGANATKYVTEGGSELIETDDGSNAVVTVTDEYADEFYKSYQESSLDEVNSTEWNYEWKSKLSGINWNGGIENMMSHWATESARKDAFRYYQTGDAGYMQSAIASHTAVYRNDPVSWAASIAGAGYGAGVARANKVVPKRGIQVTEAGIAKALEGSTMKTLQGKVSMPVVQRYVGMLEEGSVAPPIKVANGVIVEGNHRYVAGRIFGVVPEQVPYAISPSQMNRVVPIQKTVVDFLDWGAY